ncbi:hypothetical protein GW796_09540 [archaeon]|nr:hypothetical protein [archaeon]
MKVKGGVTIDFKYDKNINMHVASYLDSTGKIIGEPEYAPTKALALKFLKENGPVIEFENKKQAERDY